MRLATALGVAFASLAMAAHAQPDHTRVIVRHAGGATMNVDSDGDGWMTRAEAGAAAERMFAELDTNNDERLDLEDRGEGEFEFSMNGPGAPELEGDNCTTTVEPADGAESAERRVTVICHGEGENGERRSERRVTVERGGEAPRAENREEHRERHTERSVVIINGDRVWSSDGDADAIAPAPPMPPIPPHATMLFMGLDGPGEADLNGDGAMSLEEFRAQQLRFFDARDANGDGRVRLEERHVAPPAAPSPPSAPNPPSPPRRR